MDRLDRSRGLWGCPRRLHFLEICLLVLGRPSDFRFFEQLPDCSGVAPFFDALCVNRPKLPHHLSPEQVPPCPTLPDANRFELSRRFHSPASLRSFTVSNGPGFRDQEQPSVLPLSSPLSRSTCRVSRPCASLVANQIKSRQDFPRYPRPNAYVNAAVLYVEPSLRLPTFGGFSAARFQSQSPTRLNTSTNYRLTTNGCQRL